MKAWPAGALSGQIWKTARIPQHLWATCTKAALTPREYLCSISEPFKLQFVTIVPYIVWHYRKEFDCIISGTRCSLWNYKQLLELPLF